MTDRFTTRFNRMHFIMYVYFIFTNWTFQKFKSNKNVFCVMQQCIMFDKNQYLNQDDGS